MFDPKKRKRQFCKIVDQMKLKANLSTCFAIFSDNLNLAFDKLLIELQSHDLEMKTCVQLIDLVLYDEKNGGKSTVARLLEKYKGYSDFMLGSYMRLRREPNDRLLKELIKFDLDNGLTIDQLVTSGWFYYRMWNSIEGLENVILQSKETWDNLHKVVIST